MIKRKRCDIYCERLYCDECGAEMQQQNVTFMTNPPQVPYKCPGCGWEVTLPIIYPNTIRVELSEEQVIAAANVMKEPEGRQ